MKKKTTMAARKDVSARLRVPEASPTARGKMIAMAMCLFSAG